MTSHESWWVEMHLPKISHRKEQKKMMIIKDDEEWLKQKGRKDRICIKNVSGCRKSENKIWLEPVNALISWVFDEGVVWFYKKFSSFFFFFLFTRFLCLQPRCWQKKHCPYFPQCTRKNQTNCKHNTWVLWKAQWRRNLLHKGTLHRAMCSCTIAFAYLLLLSN